MPESSHLPINKRRAVAGAMANATAQLTVFGVVLSDELPLFIGVPMLAILIFLIGLGFHFLVLVAVAFNLHLPWPFPRNRPASRQGNRNAPASARRRLAGFLVYFAAVMMPAGVLFGLLTAYIVNGKLYDRPVSLATAENDGWDKPKLTRSTSGPVISYPVADSDAIYAGWYLKSYRSWYLHAVVQVATSQAGTSNCLSGETALTVTVFGDNGVVYGPKKVPLGGGVVNGSGGSSLTNALTLGYVPLGNVTQLEIKAAVTGATGCSSMHINLADATVHSAWPFMWHLIWNRV